MTLPGADRATVDVDKLRHYCLNSGHQRGRHKARVFASALRLSQSDAEWLRVQLLQAALQYNATLTGWDKNGQRYVVDFDCINGDKRALVLLGWIVRRDENFPRLTTCYVLSQ